MSYLLDFVKTFNDEELKQFMRLDLSGKEEWVRDTYGRSAKDKSFNEASLPGKLGISQSHFDKINSILLDKTIRALFGNDYSKAMFSILHKGLTALLLHEIKILEKKIAAETDKVKVLAFYKAAFENLRSMFHPNYNSKLTRNMGQKYLALLGTKKTIADESYINMLALYGDIIAAAHGRTENAFKPKALKTLSEWEATPGVIKNPTAAFYLYFAKATYYKHLTEDADSFLRANENALKAFTQSKTPIEAKYEGTLLCELGFGNMACNRFEQAYRFYASAFQKFPETIGRSVYHAGNFFASALLSRQADKAENIYDRYLVPKILPGTNRSVLFDIYFMHAWYNIHQQHYSIAFERLQQLKQYKKNEVTALGQVMVRVLESACFYFSGDIKTAALTIDKNLRVLQKIAASSSTANYYLQYVDILGKLIKLKQGKLRSPQKLKEQIAALPQGIYQFYSLPLANAYNKLIG